MKGGAQARDRGAWEVFPEATLDALASAVEIDDVVDPDVSLPDRIEPACSAAQMRRSFALAWQFWNAGVTRRDLLALVRELARAGDLDPGRRRQYKDIRARYKQLRFALALFGRRHREPALLGLTVRALGALQDAFRYGQRRRVRRYCWLFRILLSAPLWDWVRWRAASCRLDTAEGLLACRGREVARLRHLLRQSAFPGREFHAMRKIVSRQVAFYGYRQILDPDDPTWRLWRFLSAINGLMGSRHDTMVQQDFAGEQDYQSALPLPHEIRWRLEAFAAAWPA